MSNQGEIFLAGASRGVGREIAQRLAAQLVPVKALLRSEAAQAELEALGISVVIGDALNPAAVQRAMTGAPIQAVISTLGGLPQDGQRADYLGNKNLIDAAVQAGVQKFILVSSIGSGNSRSAIPPQALEALAAVLAEKEQAEHYLIESGLTYVIIRPGGLKSEPATGTAVLTPDPTIAGTIHRADVAELVCKCLVSNQANNRILSAVDRNMTYTQTDFEILMLD
ncbi:MAG: SDR family oxidoreductase [Synechococcales cyanobacterium M58_A2018_015]|nr:SDR family oxidoreductase [Synechococcales cyanobacterium M58_A2018_015]